MTIPKRFAALALAGTFVLVACSGGGSTPEPSDGASSAPSTGASAEPVTGTVSVDGSSTVYPITEAVAEEFQIANPGSQVSVAFSGTGGGFKKFCVGETDINDASRPIKADDEAEGVACEANGVEWVELQVALDGLTVALNPENDWARCLTVEQLAVIYGPDSPQDLAWSDVDASWPDEPIDRYMPGADSGTFDYFTEEINGETDVATQHATQSEDDNVLVKGVAGNKYAIAFFGYAYYEENADKLVAAEVDGGAGCVAPTTDTINDGSYSPLSRPLFIYPDTGKAKASPVLAAFVDFYLANAAALAADTGYVAMPDSEIAAEQAEWQQALGR